MVCIYRKCQPHDHNAFSPPRLAQKCSHNCTRIKMKSKSIYSTTSFSPATESGQIKGLKNILYFQFMVRLHKYSTQQRTLGEREKSGRAHTECSVTHGYPTERIPCKISAATWLSRMPLSARGINCWIGSAWQDQTQSSWWLHGWHKLEHKGLSQASFGSPKREQKQLPASLRGSQMSFNQTCTVRAAESQGT